MSEVLVTGGAGFIGSHLTEALAAAGHRVRVLDDLSSGKIENLASVRSKISFERGSILDTKLVDSLAEGCSCVFHLAAIVSVPRSMNEPVLTHDVNAGGTLIVLEAAKRAKARFILSSSAAVYGEAKHAPIRESEPTHPISAYGAQKLYGENLAACAALQGYEAFCLRYFNVYGPRQDPTSPYSGVISVFADRVRNGEPLVLYGDGKQSRDFVHVSDIVRANVLAMTARGADGSALNIGTGCATNLLQLSQLVFRAAGKMAAIRHDGARPGDIRKSYSDPSAARQRLGFMAMVSLEKGLVDLLSASSAQKAR